MLQLVDVLVTETDLFKSASVPSCASSSTLLCLHLNELSAVLISSADSWTVKEEHIPSPIGTAAAARAREKESNSLPLNPFMPLSFLSNN